MICVKTGRVVKKIITALLLPYMVSPHMVIIRQRGNRLRAGQLVQAHGRHHALHR